MRALCNGRNELPSPPQSYGGALSHVSEILITCFNYLGGKNNFLGTGSRAVNMFAHRERSGVKGSSGRHTRDTVARRYRVLMEVSEDQINSLAADAKMRAAEVSARGSKGLKSKKETAAKYGW